jgi:hypothetical protein
MAQKQGYCFVRPFGPQFWRNHPHLGGASIQIRRFADHSIAGRKNGEMNTRQHIVLPVRDHKDIPTDQMGRQ